MTARQNYWAFARFGVHVEWLTPRIGILRVFTEPIGQIDRETGQPWKAWAWCCVIQQRRGRIVVCGAHTAPQRDWMRGFKQMAADMGATRLQWERWHEGRKFALEFQVP